VKLHELKILPEYAHARQHGRKTDELRKDDRDYEVDDIVLLREWSDGAYYGWSQLNVITGILRNHEGLAPGWCILHLAVLETRR